VNVAEEQPSCSGHPSRFRVFKAKVGVVEDFMLTVTLDIAEAAWPPLGDRRSGRYSYGPVVTVTYPNRAAWLAARAVGYLDGWRALPHNIKIAAGGLADIGTGYIVGYEPRWGWTVRPACGWRSWRWPARPIEVNRDLGPEDHDEASDWGWALLSRAESR